MLAPGAQQTKVLFLSALCMEIVPRMLVGVTIGINPNFEATKNKNKKF